MTRKSKKENRTRRSRHTPLKQHRKIGTRLKAPLSGLPLSPIDWQRDFLPEHLWLAGLADVFGLERAHQAFHAFMDAIDPFLPSDCLKLGLLSDFGSVSPDQREAFYTSHDDLILKLFHRPIGRILAFYPDNPASWLIRPQYLESESALDPDRELGRLRRLVWELLKPQDDFAAHIRTLPFARLLKHGKLAFPSTFDVKNESGEPVGLLALLPKYPGRCTTEEKHIVQSFIRAVMMTFLGESGPYQDHSWAQYFWRHNLHLATCKPRRIPLHGARPVTAEEGPAIGELVTANAQRIEAYVTRLIQHLSFDLYDPIKDEIHCGLFARILRLYHAICSDPYLWARDLGGIMLRCLADTAITFAWLAKCGTAKDYQRFQEHGEGQEKLLMLHLQDSHPGEVSLEGRDSDILSQELGGFTPEMIDIELGHWNKKNAREMAHDIGMERLYRIVFTIASGDVHGTWISVKYNNLGRCAEPLHRLHRLPSIDAQVMFMHVMAAAQEVTEYCLDLAVESLKYPRLGEPLERLVIHDQDVEE